MSMSSLIQYRPLFSVQSHHEYYLPRETSLYQGISITEQRRIREELLANYRTSRDFKISPTPACSKLLNNHRLIFKADKMGFFVACKVTGLPDGTFVPFIPLNESFSLRFAVQLENQYFLNFSNLRMEKEAKNKDHFLHYFSNRANNSVGEGPHYLSRAVPEFDASKAYEAGEIIVDLTNPADPRMLEAIKDNGPAIFNNSDWARIFQDMIPLPQFVTNEDRVVLRPKVFKHNVESVARESLTFFIYDYDGVFQKALNFDTKDPGTPLKECELKLSDLPSACYSFEVRDIVGTTFPELGLRFFMDDALYIQRPFALIECFHKPDGSLNKYRWLDNNNKLLSPNYAVHWKNRSTFWRYYYANAPVFTSTQVKVFEPTPGNPIDRILVSTGPLGLTRLGRQIEIDLDDGTVFLANPEAVSIFPEGDRIYSEINMGGGLGPPS